MQIVANYHDD